MIRTFNLTTYHAARFGKEDLGVPTVASDAPINRGDTIPCDHGAPMANLGNHACWSSPSTLNEPPAAP
jgi:hypothetical protein